MGWSTFAYSQHGDPVIRCHITFNQKRGWRGARMNLSSKGDYGALHRTVTDNVPPVSFRGGAHIYLFLLRAVLGALHKGVGDSAKNVTM